MRSTVTLSNEPTRPSEDNLHFDVEFETAPRKGELIQVYIGGRAMFGEVAEVLWGFQGDSSRTAKSKVMIFAKRMDANDDRIPRNY